MSFATWNGLFVGIRRAGVVGALVLAVIGLTADSAWAIKIAQYNLLDYSSGRGTQFKTILNVIQPDILSVNEIANQAAVDYFLNNILNAADGPGGYAAATFQADGGLNNALFYRTAAISYAGSSDHTYLATSPRITDRWRVKLVGGDVYLYVYTMHLHSSDPASRLTQCTIVRNDTNSLPDNTSFVLCGDFNLDSSFETSYQQLVGSQTDNSGRAWDPINSPGTWHENYSFRAIHTQSPHMDNPDPPPGAIGGGLDDRFDFILISTSLQDGQGFDYVSGTYKAFGNDGQHFDMDINDPPTIPEGAAVANALHGASDHLPVSLELRAPPILVVPTALPFGTVLVGASSPDNEAILHVQNGGTPPGLDLTYSFTTVPSGFTVIGGTGPFTLSPGASRDHTIQVSTAAEGYPQGFLRITHNGVGSSPKSVLLYGTIVRHAVPSTSGASQVLTAPLSFGTHPIGGFTDQTASVYNLGYADLQSLLQVYAYNITGQDAARFSVMNFASTNVGGTPAPFSVHFSDAGASGRTYTAALQFSTRDDTTLRGWTNLASLTFNLSAVVQASGIKGDMDGNGSVQPADIPIFVGVLLDPAGATSAQQWAADMNGDGVDDGDDCQLFVNALLGS
ncbi:MAG TPA: choice-of-anchor D domain-containing protein [Phycisphaerae bacterium]|nr:choice-of-anchor D domain-containing protein [Phycisphaerae bacterium]